MIFVIKIYRSFNWREAHLVIVLLLHYFPLEDLGLMRLLPNMAVMAPGDPLEVRFDSMYINAIVRLYSNCKRGAGYSCLDDVISWVGRQKYVTVKIFPF